MMTAADAGSDLPFPDPNSTTMPQQFDKPPAKKSGTQTPAVPKEPAPKKNVAPAPKDRGQK